MRLREWREKKGVTQEALAHDLGIHPQYLSKIERGAQAPGSRLAKRISDFTGSAVSIEHLLFPEQQAA